MNVFYPIGTADSAPDSQAGLLPLAVGASANAGAAADEPEGGLGGCGRPKLAQPAGWPGGWLYH